MARRREKSRVWLKTRMTGSVTEKTQLPLGHEIRYRRMGGESKNVDERYESPRTKGMDVQVVGSEWSRASGGSVSSEMVLVPLWQPFKIVAVGVIRTFIRGLSSKRYLGDFTRPPILRDMGAVA